MHYDDDDDGDDAVLEFYLVVLVGCIICITY